jgi:CRISPR-associated protein Csd1
MALDSNNFREWRKALSIACSIYKGYYGGYEMSLEEDRRTRDYLYGRLLALADLAESSALRKAGESRPTNAKRMMQRFSEYPYVTWLNIELSLSPYLDRLGPGLANYYVNQISNVMEMFDGDDFRDNSKLSGEFLLAYHCQCNKVYNGSNKEGDE